LIKRSWKVINNDQYLIDLFIFKILGRDRETDYASERRPSVKNISILFACFVMLMVCFLPLRLHAGREEIKVSEAAEVVREIMAIPEQSIPPSFLDNAAGIAVIPGLIKAGFVIGGRYGQGIISVRTSDGSWSNPSFITLTGGSIGWQIGAQSTDIILVFKSRKSIDNLTNGKFTLGADASIAAGPVGRHAEAGTDIRLKAEIYSYSRSRGLFAGIALEGAALQVDAAANETYYGRSISLRDIFTGQVSQRPAAGESFRQVLNKSVPHR